MKTARAAILLLASASLTAAGSAAAHPITVDGLAAEWLARSPNADNLGLVARDANGRGEHVWRDAAADSRTDLASPESVADITAVQVTGSPAGLGVLVRLADPLGAGAPVQVQVAIDLDRVAGSGQTFLAGFADTTVSDAARWERLVQTLFGSNGAATVLDPGFNAVGSASAVRGADGVEILVPWAALGLAGPPAAPVRLAVATFRAQPSDVTVDIGGPGLSNALDVMTDYGDPGTAPNTFAEVGDSVLGYSADVHFDPQGEVYAPLLVTRFVASSPGAGSGEWVTLRNVGPAALALPGFKVGDEETPDGGEGMYTFPAGLTLAPGASMTIAAQAATYSTVFPAPPAAELAASDPGVPDMVKVPAWSSGNWALANAGDEILVLDPSNTLLDVVTFGAGAYPGVTAAAAPGSDVVLSRDGLATDTDDNLADFAVLGPACASDATCAAPCETCAGNACEPTPQGTPCADGDPCDGAEACDGLGACAAGAPLDCSDADECTADSCSAAVGCQHAAITCDDADACTIDACDSTRGCVTDPVDCDDADACTVATCDPVTGCGQTAIVCDDANPCTIDGCSPGTGCSAAPEPPGTPCGDGDACNGAETCSADGVCASPGALDCDDGDPCTDDSCDPAGGCAHAVIPGCGGGGNGGGGAAATTGTTTATGTTGSGNTGATTGGPIDDGGGVAADEGGCGCRLAGDRSARRLVWLAAALAAALALRRRRR